MSDFGNFASEGHALISGMVMAALMMGSGARQEFHVEILGDHHGNYIPRMRVWSDLVPGGRFIVETRPEDLGAERNRLRKALERTIEELQEDR